MRDNEAIRQDMRKLHELGYKFETLEVAEKLGAELQKALGSRSFGALSELMGEPFSAEIALYEDIDPWHGGVEMATKLGTDGGLIYSPYAGVCRKVLSTEYCKPNEQISFEVPAGGVEAYWLADAANIRTGNFDNEVNIAQTFDLVTEVIEKGYTEMNSDPLGTVLVFAKIRSRLGQALDIEEEDLFFTLADNAVPNGAARTVTGGREQSSRAGSDYVSMAVLATEDHTIDNGETSLAFTDVEEAYNHLAHHVGQRGKPVSTIVIPNGHRFDMADWVSGNVQLFSEQAVDRNVQEAIMPRIAGADVIAHTGMRKSGGTTSAIIGNDTAYLFGSTVGYIPYRKLPSGRRREVIVREMPSVEPNPRLVWQFLALENIGMVIANPYHIATIDMAAGS